MQHATRERLQLFLEKADEMSTEKFRSHLKDNPRISFQFNSDEGITDRNAPNKTLIKSFATIYRIFTS